MEDFNKLIQLDLRDNVRRETALEVATRRRHIKIEEILHDAQQQMNIVNRR